MRQTRMNTAPLNYSGSFRIVLCFEGWRTYKQEVAGSSPALPTIVFNALAG